MQFRIWGSATVLAGGLALAVAGGSAGAPAGSELESYERAPGGETDDARDPSGTRPPATTSANRAKPRKLHRAETRIGPLDTAQRDHLYAGPEDALTPTEVHYVKSNEIRHDVWIPYIRDVGGAYVGVGADQNYTLIGAARSEFVFLLDIDQRVVDLHRVYERLIEASATPATLLARFEPRAEAATCELLRASFSREPAAIRTRLVNGYRVARETVRRHLAHVSRRRHASESSSWLSHAGYYQHIRSLYHNDRVRIMGGDLTGARTMSTVATNARALGALIEVLYLSNAEEYFKYNRQYRANIAGLPSSRQGVALRTIYSKKWEHAARLWNYQVHHLRDFQRRMVASGSRSRTTMLGLAARDKVLERTTETKGLSRVATQPPAPVPVPVPVPDGLAERSVQR